LMRVSRTLEKHPHTQSCCELGFRFDPWLMRAFDA
jgi:hypothetical protein